MPCSLREVLEVPLSPRAEHGPPGLEEERSLEGTSEKNLPTDQSVSKELAAFDQGPPVLP